jgi:triacylglycerol lipase
MAEVARLVPYDATRRSLYRPGAADDFFARGVPQSVTAVCAELSRLSYSDDDERRRGSLRRAGLEQHSFHAAHGTEVLVAVAPGRAYVAFRGTDNPRALVNDLEVAPVPWVRGGKVHSGFAEYLGHVRGSLEETLGELAGRTLVFTGHSLGAAAATLALSLWPEATLYAFGSPRVGDEAFARTLPPGAERFVDCCDVVCRVPPEQLGYVHVGRVCYIDRLGIVAGQIDREDLERDQAEGRRAYLLRHAWAFWKNVLFRDFADHSPVNYVSALSSKPTS